MGLGEKREAKLRAIAQEQLVEPVLGAAVVVRPRSKVARSFGLVGALAQTAMDASSKDTDFAPYNLFAITDAALHAFEISGNTLKVKSVIGAWLWGTFGASIDGRGANRTLTLQWNDSTASTLEVPVKGVQKFQLDALDQIVRRTAVAQDGGPALG
jgi:hypothetical protein